MPPALLALMIQSAFRVTFERESLRLAFFLGVLPSVVSLGLTNGADALYDLDREDVYLIAMVGTLIGLALAVPFAVKAGGDLVARALDRPPAVSPGIATRRAYLVLLQIFGLMAAFGAVLGVIGGLAPGLLDNPVLRLAVAAVVIYVAAGFVFGPILAFFGETVDPRRSFALARGSRPKLLAFLMVVGLPYFVASIFVSSIAVAQPDSAIILAVLVALVGGFVNGLSYGPHLIGLTQAYFALTGETPPSLNIPAGPRT
ncbi:hypothetical protein [Zavarzinia aquatilis]|uniref:Uncharacterized protein n=1 Tax=Zavarzinia aquatilis TaxID=2211142 RepID=A0A317EGE4_9PROT|nr:hypothetical protein [Zavarzinia aquatilis]PWR24483.1 hypothetical protein DKG74_06665 [Zavarzinia aquatilis]